MGNKGIRFLLKQSGCQRRYNRFFHGYHLVDTLTNELTDPAKWNLRITSDTTGQLTSGNYLKQHDISHVGVSPVFARWGLRGILRCLAIGRGSGFCAGGHHSSGAFGLLLAAGLWARLCGWGLLGWWLDSHFLLQFVALQEAKLDTELQDGFLLLVDGLVQVGVFVLRGNKDTDGAWETNYFISIFTERNCYMAHVNAHKNILRKKTTPKILIWILAYEYTKCTLRL